MSRLGGLRLQSLDERAGALAYAAQVVALTIGCHLKVVSGAVQGWGAVAFLVGPVVLWVLAAIAVRYAWRP